jgi:hypothetical protein
MIDSNRAEVPTMTLDRRWPELETSLEQIEQGVIDCSSDAFPPYELDEWELRGEPKPDQLSAAGPKPLVAGSAAFQAVLRQGRTVEAKRMVLLLGGKRFGPPTSASKDALESIDDLVQIEDLADRLLEARSWDELLAGPTTGR